MTSKQQRLTASTDPDMTLQDFARAAGHPAKLLWEMKGPALTMVAWLSCYSLGKSTVIIQTFEGGGWCAYTPNDSVKVDETVLDAFNRCGVPAPTP